MPVRNTLLKRCRASKNFGFQTVLLPYKRLTPRQFNIFLKTFPMMPGDRLTKLAQSNTEDELQMEIGNAIHNKFNKRITTTLTSLSTGRQSRSLPVYYI